MYNTSLMEFWFFLAGHTSSEFLFFLLFKVKKMNSGAQSVKKNKPILFIWTTGTRNKIL